MGDIAVGLQRGERAPDMVLPTGDGTPTRYYAHAGGRPALLVLAGVADAPALRTLTTALEGHGDDLSIHIVGPQALADAGLGLPLLVDPDGRAGQVYRTQGQATAFLLDPNLRVSASVLLGDGVEVVDTVLAALEAAANRPEPREIALQAPVLVIPDVLDEIARAELIALWESEHVATGVEASADGRRTEDLSSELKRRRDHIIRDQQRSAALAKTIGRRVMPEISRAFAYSATRFEGFKIGRYDAQDRGFFSLHRDNLSPATAHRRFALTLNLNDDYDGGQLRFPEYGMDLYRPPAGAALIFSGSLLHEVLDVTRGHRVVLLSFLFGDEVRRQG